MHVSNLFSLNDNDSMTHTIIECYFKIKFYDKSAVDLDSYSSFTGELKNKGAEFLMITILSEKVVPICKNLFLNFI